MQNVLAAPLTGLTQLRRLRIAVIVQLTVYDIEECAHFDVAVDESAAKWADALGKLAALTELCLAGIGGEWQAAAALGPAIVALPCLQSLEVRGCRWLHWPLGPLFQMAHGEGPAFAGLKSVQLSSPALGCAAESWHMLHQALTRMHTLRSL